MNARDKSRDAKTGSAAQRRAAEEAKKAKDAAAECDSLERFADDGGSWVPPPDDAESTSEKRPLRAPSVAAKRINAP